MSVVRPQLHHVRGQESGSRPSYRRGRKATAVKVFTIADESVHVLVFGVPALHLQTELTNRAQLIGDCTVYKVEDYPDLEEFSELFHLKYSRLVEARAAKNKLDGLEFFGGILHVCYAPELESIDETRAKLIQRSKFVRSKIPRRQVKQLRGFQESI